MIDRNLLASGQPQSSPRDQSCYRRGPKWQAVYYGTLDLITSLEELSPGN